MLDEPELPDGGNDGDGDLAVVFRSASAHEARTAADLLRDHGIDCEMESETLLDPTAIENIHVVEEPRFLVLVPEHLADAASSTLEARGMSSEVDPELLEMSEKPWVTSLRRVSILLILATFLIGLSYLLVELVG